MLNEDLDWVFYKSHDYCRRCLTLKRACKLLQREAIVSKVKQYTDTDLNPNKVNFLDPTKSNFQLLKRIS